MMILNGATAPPMGDCNEISALQSDAGRLLGFHGKSLPSEDSNHIDWHAFANEIVISFVAPRSHFSPPNRPARPPPL